MDLYDTAMRFPWQLAPQHPALRYAELRQAGLTKGQTYWRTGRSGLSRPHHGAYLTGGVAPGLVDRIRAALLVVPSLAVLGFHTAAQLYGFGVARTDTIHLLVPAGTPFPQRRGITAHQVVLPVGDPVDVLGLPCVTPARCAVDLARHLRRVDALPVLDAALFCGVCGVEDLLVEVKRHDGLRGVCQARELAALANGRAECRQESQLRLILHDGGVRGLVSQFPVPDDLGCLARHRIDLADPDRQVGIEYDGSSHLDRRRLRTDRERHNWLESRGWSMRYFTDHDLYARPDSIIETVTSARRSRENSRAWRSTSRNLP